MCALLVVLNMHAGMVVTALGIRSLLHTTIRGFRTLFGRKFLVRITTRSAARDRAWGARRPCCDSALDVTSGWLALHPITWAGAV